MTGLNLFQLLDAAFDKVAHRLAQNLCSNAETVARNRAARELSELSDQQLCQRGVEREKLKQGSEAYPWRSTYSHIPREDLEKFLYFLMTESECTSKDQFLFTA